MDGNDGRKQITNAYDEVGQKANKVIEETKYMNKRDKKLFDKNWFADRENIQNEFQIRVPPFRRLDDVFMSTHGNPVFCMPSLDVSGAGNYSQANCKLKEGKHIFIPLQPYLRSI